MAFIGNNNDFLKGLAIGVGIALAAPLVIRSLSGSARPLAKAALKTGMTFYEKSRETMAEVGEVVEDLMAEVSDEVESELSGATNETRQGDEVVEQTAEQTSPTSDNVESIKSAKKKK